MAKIMSKPSLLLLSISKFGDKTSIPNGEDPESECSIETFVYASPIKTSDGIVPIEKDYLLIGKEWRNGIAFSINKINTLKVDFSFRVLIDNHPMVVYTSIINDSSGEEVVVNVFGEEQNAVIFTAFIADKFGNYIEEKFYYLLKKFPENVPGIRKKDYVLGGFYAELSKEFYDAVIFRTNETFKNFNGYRSDWMDSESRLVTKTGFDHHTKSMIYN